jgi:hypothetical protein
MQRSRSDEELIRAVRAQTRRQDARMLRDMGSHAACTCSSNPKNVIEHDTNCPLFIWHSAARALELLAED